jgi:hypothetical protein
MQLGLVAVSLLYGRQIPFSEYPHSLPHLLTSEFVTLNDGPARPLPAALRSWLECALQIDSRFSFASGQETWEELETALARTDLTVPSTAEAFVIKCRVNEREDELPALPQAHVGQTSQGLVVHRPVEALTVIEPEPVAMVPHAEGELLPAPITRARTRRSRFRFAAIIALIVGAAIGLAAWRYRSSTDTHMGTFSLQTTPSQVDVNVDGRPHGATPVVLKLAEGAHTIELHWRGQSRTLPITLRAGETSSHFIELPAAQTELGRLEVHTEPEGAQVTVDNVPVGQSPIRLDLSAGQHSISVQAKARTATQLVNIRAATTTSLLVPFPSRSAAPATFGWIAVDAPVEVQIYERGQMLGSSQTRQLMTSVGTHNLEVVNDVLGYRRSFAVQVRPGQVTSLKVEFPRGSVTMTSNPPADAWIDGTRVGRTPIKDLPVALGPHEVVLRHPELGERHYAITVTLAEPAHLTADLTRR